MLGNEPRGQCPRGSFVFVLAGGAHTFLVRRNQVHGNFGLFAVRAARARLPAALAAFAGGETVGKAPSFEVKVDRTFDDVEQVKVKEAEKTFKGDKAGLIKAGSPELRT